MFFRSGLIFSVALGRVDIYHSRADGNPYFSIVSMDSRLRGNDRQKYL